MVHIESGLVVMKNLSKNDRILFTLNSPAPEDLEFWDPDRDLDQFRQCDLEP